jgi:hypothetical protein
LSALSRVRPTPGAREALLPTDEHLAVIGKIPVASLEECR